MRPPQFSATIAQRTLLLPSVLAVHAALLIWIAADTVAPSAPAKATTLAVFDLAPPAASVRPAKRLARSVVRSPTEPPPVATPIVSPPLMPISLPPPAAQASADGSCDLTDDVTTAVRDDVEAREALLAWPQKARSVANAVMLWDGRWVAEDGARSFRAMSRVRRVIQAVVTQASDACRVAPQAGPRLITVAGPPDMVLALGSGRWHWGDLAPDQTMADAAAQLDSPPIATASAQ